MKRTVMMVSILLGSALLGAYSVEVQAEGAQKKGVFRNIVQTFRPPSGKELTKISNDLELNDEQKQQMKEVNDRFKQQTSTLKQRYGTGYEKVVKLMNTEQPNKANVNQTLKNFHNTHSQIVDAEVQYWMDLKTILTPAQNLKLWRIFEQSRIR